MSRRGEIKSLNRQVEEASQRFLSFSGHELEREYRIVPPNDDVVFVFGDLWGIGYTAMRDGKVERYLHEFRPSSSPLLASSPDGEQLYILGGKYKFGSRGIVDK